MQRNTLAKEGVNTAGLEIDSDEQTFKLKLVPTTTNFQIKIDYNTDFSNQNLFFRIVEG